MATGIDVVEDIAVDWVGGNLYWTDYGMETIEVVTLDGDYRMVLFSENITNPRAIEVDPRDGSALSCFANNNNITAINQRYEKESALFRTH